MIQDTSFIETRIGRAQFQGETLQNCRFLRCNFANTDLSEARFLGCSFYDDQQQAGCTFQRASLKDASFNNCDLTMADFRNISALGC
jgi:fluoroquinolone resistance protein